jgi:hypothetical protein
MAEIHFLFLWILFPALDVINTNGLSVFSSFGALYNSFPSRLDYKFHGMGYYKCWFHHFHFVMCMH